ncbi:hypothetical protein IRJ41_008045 [Triplophysa rosa]|uniref:Uncharacterized protein n=1 Tax=Triplophysa rosa TaxID=992332 RepID=A0A9W7X0Y2_TRIRA|nr:hypothetical protein IRJ41_008045 [Triplophysa rosa]
MAFSGKEIPSIQRGCKVPTLSKCTSCCSLYHCPFCGTSFYKPSKKCKVQTHQLHFSRTVVHDDYTIHRCGLGCQTKLHYHCVYCFLIVFRRNNFVDHLTRCKISNGPLTSTVSSTIYDVPHLTATSPTIPAVPPLTTATSSNMPAVPLISRSLIQPQLRNRTDVRTKCPHWHINIQIKF